MVIDVDLFVTINLQHIEISNHYGASHLAAALVLYGLQFRDRGRYEAGVCLLKSLLKRWDESKKLHADFNHFAICVVADALKDKDGELCKMIQKVVLSSDDNAHETVNWLPMRWYVNKKRYEWSGEEKFLSKCDYCRSLIIKATNQDGGIEDRLPKGVSFNLQYDTVNRTFLHHVSGEVWVALGGDS